ncbi:MAG: TetR/AcrR family transcriptional regulator [Brevundimonas sp.]|uniref:TetR/AcrR family transcriptional regulator n=1 Tax=Brevundimonas sp. TaxID=1871086 RepID=UPI00261EFA45|nr:TetR/AcrR family transcriptional regulator [Brevundimonas sp.]MDI6625024.1 TetR/AcrR family transcriptional regulator [Brevundimonas sp.]MDQ7811858.1 TetR/AcrR family transcriptional regulator [Brevundimonas sp.]
MHGSAAPRGALHDPKRQLIVRHAREHFVREGYAATRIEPIAREAGVSTATLYTLFRSKAALFTAVIDDAAEEFTRQMARVRAVEGDARSTLTSFADAYAAFMGDPFVRSVFRLVVAERPRFQAVARRFFEKGRTEFGATLIGVIVRLSKAGALRPIEHPSWAAGHLMGMVEHPVFFVPLVTGDEVRVRRTNAEVVAEAVETFLARYGA